MRPAIGPSGKPLSIDIILRQVFTVDGTLPVEIENALARLAAKERQQIKRDVFVAKAPKNRRL